MEEQIQASPEVVAQLRRIDDELDAVVDHGDDEYLFIASYLQGHYAVIARVLEMESDASLQELDRRMQASFTRAFENKELEIADQDKVQTLWQRLLTAAK